MEYYRVKRRYDGRLQGKQRLVANELYTLKELMKAQIPMQCVNKVNISQRSTYTFFGCRFETGTNQNSVLD